MMNYSDLPNLNAPKSYSSLYARTLGNTAHIILCFRCRLNLNIDRAIDDSNGKRHNLRGVDLIQHEVKCVSELQKIVNYYNRHELSSFQVEMIIP